MEMCRGQAFDGAASMQGIRKGLATLIKMENPAALSVHCFAHCLNLCLHEAGRNLVLLRDALDTARNCKATCINYFSKKVQPLNEKLVQSEAGHTGVGCVTGYQVIRVIRIFAKTYPFE